MNATYSPEDNKLRLYADSKLPNDLYKRVKAAGFQWAPKQELFVAPAWTPGREDLLLELCEEIEDEDYSATERAADRADRFSNYRDKRVAEANDKADNFEAGPTAFGHQSQARAERMAARHDKLRTGAVCQWSKAEYWQSRTAGVISNALYKAKPEVRRARIKRLEADQRKHEKTGAEFAERYKAWAKVPTLDGADLAIVTDKRPGYFGMAPDSATKAGRLAYALVNNGCWGEYKHPRTGRETSLYSLMTDDQDPITPREAAAIWLAKRQDPDAPGHTDRWGDHYRLRLAYERAMLENEGGTAAKADMVPGGWLGSYQIQKVNRSPVTGQVVSVQILAPSRAYQRSPQPGAPLTLQSLNVERFAENVYRAPTPEEAEAFATSTKARKADEKTSRVVIPLLNPTPEEAQRLQDHWNAAAQAKHDAHKKTSYLGEYKTVKAIGMTQAEYTARSAGSYSRFETVEVCQNGHRPKTRYGSNIDPSPIAFKVRKTYGTGEGGSFSSFAADAVVYITDKPAKPLPAFVDAPAVVESDIETANV